MAETAEARRRVGAFLSPRESLAAATALVRQAEDLGYDSAWVTHAAGRDSFLVLACFAHATRRIAVASGVVPVYPRHPVTMAQEAATLAEVSGGRFRLGLGVSHAPSMADALGLDMGRPLDVMREYVAVVRGALTGRVRFAGRYFRVAWEGAFRVPTPPPVLLAGLAAPMLELAGELADGVVLWLCAPAYVRSVVVPAVTRGRARAGKPLAGFEVVAAVPAAVTDDVAGVGATFREELTRYLALPFYRAMLRASGFGEALAAFDRDRGRGRPADAVPAVLVAALGAVGDRATVRAYVEAYRAAGVTLPVVRPIGVPEASHALSTLESAAPCCGGAGGGEAMPLLGQGVLAIWHSMTPEGDQDMIRWHNLEHVPERVGVPGFLRGRRYAHARVPRHYLDLYETASVDTIRSAPYVERLNNPTPWTQRVLPHFRDTFRIGCRVAASAGRGQGGALVTVRLRPVPSREAALRDWLTGDGVAALREATAFVGAHLLDAVPETTAIKTAEGKLKGGEVAKADEPWPLVWLVETSDPATAEVLAAGPLGAERLTAQGAAPDAAVGAYILQLSMDA